MTLHLLHYLLMMLHAITCLYIGVVAVIFIVGVVVIFLYCCWLPQPIWYVEWWWWSLVLLCCLLSCFSFTSYRISFHVALCSAFSVFFLLLPIMVFLKQHKKSPHHLLLIVHAWILLISHSLSLSLLIKKYNSWDEKKSLFQKH